MSEPERLAVIEAGTKGVRLLVVERRDPPEAMTVLQSAGELGFLGDGLDQNAGRMRPENVRRSCQFIREFHRSARGHGAARVVLVGTEVFRRAANVEEFRQALPPPLGLRVLTPEEEAVGSFLAACWGFRERFGAGGRVVLIDLGGGSLEVVGGLQGLPPRPLAGISLREMGTYTLRDLWRRAEPARREDELRRHVGAEVGRHAAELAAFRPRDGEAEGTLLVAGLGSTVTDSAWVLNGRGRKKYSSDKVHGFRAGVPDLERHRGEVQGSGRVAEEMGIKDALGHQLGLAALLAVLRSLEARTITACGTGLRFGLAYAFLHDLPLSLAGVAPEPSAEKPRPDPPAPLWHGLPTVPPAPTAGHLEPPASGEARGDLRAAEVGRSGDRATTSSPHDTAADPALKAEVEALSEADRKALAKALGVKGRGASLVECLLAAGADVVRSRLRALQRDYTRRKLPELRAELERRRLPVAGKPTREALIRALEQSDKIADRLSDPEPAADAARAAVLQERRGQPPLR